MYSALAVVTAPAGEPVSVEEAKRFLRVSHDDDDPDILDLITTARLMVERYCRRACLTTRFRWVLAQDTSYVITPIIPYLMLEPPVPAAQWELPRSSVTAVHSVTATNEANVTTTLPADQYRIQLGIDPARIQLLVPSSPRAFLALTTEFSAGYGTTASAVPMTVRTAIKTLVAWLYENRGDADTGEMPRSVIRLLAGDRVYSA